MKCIDAQITSVKRKDAPSSPLSAHVVATPLMVQLGSPRWYRVYCDIKEACLYILQNKQPMYIMEPTRIETIEAIDAIRQSVHEAGEGTDN